MTSKTQLLNELIEPVVKAFGMDLWGLQYSMHGNSSVLRVFIDSPEGVTVEDCARVSRQLSAVLDVEDPISGKYTLEVSSPGLDRQLFTLQQYQQYVGDVIRVKLNRSIENRKKIKGVLCAVDMNAETLDIEFDQQTLRVEFINIDKANVIGDIAMSNNKPPKKH